MAVIALRAGAGMRWSPFLDREKDAKEIEAEKDILYQQIGRLQVELDWLKKLLGISCRQYPETVLH
jgi:hypothetical protein